MVGHPRIERGNRLLDQREMDEPGGLRRFDGQLARLLIERRGHRQDDRLVLELQRLVVGGNGRVPGVAHVHQVLSGRSNR